MIKSNLYIFAVLTLLLIPITTVFSQDYKEVISDTYLGFKNAYNDADFKRCANYISPVYFENILSKDEWIEIEVEMNSLHETSGAVVFDEIVYVQDVMELDRKHYSCLKFIVYNTLPMPFDESAESSDSAELTTEFNNWLDLMIGPLNIEYGEENVIADPVNKNIAVRITMKYLVISEDEMKTWKIFPVEINETTNSFLSDLIPSEILIHFF